MSSDPPELGKGLFGYRKSAVNQIIADRDIMLRQAEGRVRAAESKVADLESELGSMRERNVRMDEQLERLRQQLDALSARGEPPVIEKEPPAPQQQPESEVWDEQPAPAAAGHDYTAYDEAQAQPAEEEWPGVEQDWLPEDDGVPAVDAGVEPAEQPAEAVEEDDIPYGAEVRLRGDVASESATPAWMQTGPDAGEEEDRDEVAMAAGGYGIEDYDVEEQQGYGEYSAAEEVEEEVEAGSPSPFSRFPFTSEPFDQEPAQASHVVDEPSYAEEPEPQPEPQPPEVQPHVHQPEPAPQVRVPEQPTSPVPQPPAVSAETADITNRFLTEELAGILAAAEESAARIVERARATTQRQIARSNRVWREVQAEVSRFAAWRQEVEPVIRTVQAKVEGVRSEIEEVPERIRQALAPMADTISSIDGDLAELAAACNPPLLLTPSGLESEESDPGSWGFDTDEDIGFPRRDAPSEEAFDEPFNSPPEDPYGQGFPGNTDDQGSGHLHAG